MPRGGHFGIWKPTPKDIYKSRWKTFYKRCHRRRSSLNNVDFPGAKEQPDHNYDGVPEPWRLLYSLNNFDDQHLPTDTRGFRVNNYRVNEQILLKPAEKARSASARECILRALDPGRRGGAESGHGRYDAGADILKEVAQDKLHYPKHILDVLDVTKDKKDQSFGIALLGGGKKRGVFPMRRLQALLDEHEIVWESGIRREQAQNEGKGKGKGKGGADAAPAEARGNGKGKGADEGRAKGALVTNGGLEPEEKDRGHFPFIDEQASLIDELALKDILRLSHRTKSRRHPKWKEIQYEYKQNQKSYLRRRQVNEDEAKARMGVIRQAMADA